ncbi:hypothetical protein GGI25_000645 [Coemansia spiralis]|uniref:Piwi-domain-containing protein n=2 Tax=Coemansia TaxID=4863 RepID=A0A9W8KZ36_9FUNG|nr:hypothetical protein EDC05_000600 [Coemansia umbellata]KAJ2623728.1 hypothetical protein GGI26_002175 [Coemansia sp. RSA 1358]KAJ2680353.1 hypothetical protein GGI25_000645 [Coemansia spiralis]
MSQTSAHVKQYGTLGRKQRVFVNYVELTKYPEGNIYQYDVELAPECGAFQKLPAPAFMRAVFDQAMRTFRTTKLKGIPLVYDARRIAYAPQPICHPKETLTLSTTYTDSGRTEAFIIQIRQTAVINTSILTEYIKGRKSVEIADIQPILTALDLAIGSVVHGEMLGFNRSFFTPDQSKMTSGALELWRGFSFSVRPGVEKLYLNINTAVTAMYSPGSLLELMQRLLDLNNINQLRGGLSPQMINKLGSYLRGLVLYLTHRGIQGKRKFAAKGLTGKPLDKESFEWEDPTRPGNPETVTVAQYYQRRYNIALRYPFLPGLVGRKKAVFPIEMCDVAPNQRYRGKLDEKQTSDMVTFACSRPSDNMDRITRALSTLELGSSPVVKSFGMVLPSKLSEIESRVLPPPTIMYGSNSRQKPKFSPQGGAWNMRDLCITKAGKPLKYWAVLILASSKMAPDNKVQAFIAALVDMCNRTGYRIDNPRPPIARGNQGADIAQEMRKACHAIRLPSGEAPQLLLVVLPTTNAQIYQTVKNCAYTTLGIQTQCMQAKHIQRPNPQYCANLCLKINAKLGGTNQSLQEGDMQIMLRKSPTLFMGCDVTHPAPGEQFKPSIASVVGSTDLMGLRYAATLIQLPSRQELVNLLFDAVVRHLKLFFKNTRTKPKHIIFYRDGVSETQFNQTRDRELVEILRACSSIEAGYKPQVTFLAVLKRHNTRFFPIGRDGDRTGNCVPGTIIDRSVTMAPLFDFYLFSHAAIQGTSRPTHYYVLHNDAGFTADEIQKLTYYLCYTYAICTRSVSLVPPVYYAHRVADRARCHLVGMGKEFDDASSAADGYYTGVTNIAPRTAPTHPSTITKLIVTHPRLEESMYFM